MSFLTTEEKEELKRLKGKITSGALSKKSMPHAQARLQEFEALIAKRKAERLAMREEV